MQEEARLKQSLFQYRHKLLHCISEVTCVSVPCTGGSAMGTEAQAGAALSLWWAAGAARGPQLRDCSPILQAAPCPLSGLLNSSCLVEHISRALKAATYLDSNNDFLIINDKF